MDFADAFMRMKNGGKRVTRPSYEPDTYIFIRDKQMLFFNKAVDLPCRPTHDDIMAEDWELYNAADGS